MNGNPLISVIVPVYMTDRYTGACIESIMNQTYKNLEIILVDDGSKDMCPQLCDLYASKDSRIKVIHKENGGLVSGRKAGILASRGDYIGYVDGDDWIGPGYYQAMLDAIEDSNADIAVAGFSRDLFNKSDRMLNAIPPGIYKGESLDFFYKNMISYGDFFNHGITTYFWNKLFRREAIFPFQLAVDNSFFVLEDGSAVFPAMLNSKCIVVTDNYAYHYRQREGSMLKSVADLKKESVRLKAVNDFLLNAIKDYPERYQLRKQVDDLMLSTYIVRCGGIKDICNKQDLSFIFNESLDGKKVVIYGAGTFGQQMQSRLSLSKTTQIASWIDPDYWEYRRCCMDVDPISSILNVDYDYILFAGLDTNSKIKATSILQDYGVNPSKILSVDMDEVTRSKLLKQYLNV